MPITICMVHVYRSTVSSDSIKCILRNISRWSTAIMEEYITWYRWKFEQVRQCIPIADNYSVWT